MDGEAGRYPNFIVPLLLFASELRRCLFTCAIIRLSASGITKDSLPGPYPKTPEEKAAAAKKYNLRVEDYEPYPDNGEG